MFISQRTQRTEAQQTSQKIIDANNAKIEASFNTINEHLNKVDNQLANVMLINAEQTKTIEYMNEKIDTNEIDRLRWEIISIRNDRKENRLLKTNIYVKSDTILLSPDS